MNREGRRSQKESSRQQTKQAKLHSVLLQAYKEGTADNCGVTVKGDLSFCVRGTHPRDTSSEQKHRNTVSVCGYEEMTGH